MLAKMSDMQFDTYVGHVIERFAQDLAVGDEVPLEEALERTRGHITGLLRQGAQTPGHHFRTIEFEGDSVGTLWFAEQLDESRPRVYVFDIAVDEAPRGQGLGTTALHALEEEARALGATQLMLSVFLHNTGAVRLYERMGFAPAEHGMGGMRLSKAL